MQRRGVLPELWIDHHHHIVLVEGRVGGRDLALAEGVVENVVDGLGGDAQPRCRLPIDHQVRGQPAVLLIAVHIGELMQTLHRFQQNRPPVIQQIRSSVWMVY
jgi:hypothetical protein